MKPHQSFEAFLLFAASIPSKQVSIPIFDITTLIENHDIDKDTLENIDINEAILENIDTDIDKDTLENIDTNKDTLENIDTKKRILQNW